MKSIDSHTHAWGEDTEELPWVAELLPPEWSGPYTHGDLVTDMDRIGIDEAVIVTTPLYGRGERANEYTMRSIEAYPDRLYGVAIMDLFGDDPDATRAHFRRVVGHERMLGVRMHAALAYAPIPSELDRTGDWILDDRLEPIWDEAAARDKSVFVFPKAEQLSMVERLAAAHPDVSIVIDHMAWPDETTDPDSGAWTDFADVATHPNVAVKVSSLPRSSEEGWPYEDLFGYVRNLLEWFGPERLMLGSDYPWMASWDGYDDCLSWVDAAEFLSKRDRAYLSYRSFDEIHG
jgi:L-fuconolactonase